MAFLLTKKYMIGLSIAGGLLVTGAGVYLSALPTLDKITVAQEEITTAEAEVADMQGRLSGLQVSQGQYDQVKTFDQQLEEQFPSSIEESLLNEILDAERSSGITVSSVEFSPPTIVMSEAAPAADPNAPAADPNAAPADPNAAPADPNAAPADPNAAAPATSFGDGFASSTFTVSATGTPEEVQDFLGSLSANSRAIILSQTSFSDDNGAVVLSFTGKAYLSRLIEDPTTAIFDPSIQTPAQGEGGEVIVDGSEEG